MNIEILQALLSKLLFNSVTQYYWYYYLVIIAPSKVMIMQQSVVTDNICMAVKQIDIVLLLKHTWTNHLCMRMLQGCSKQSGWSSFGWITFRKQKFYKDRNTLIEQSVQHRFQPELVFIALFQFSMLFCMLSYMYKWPEYFFWPCYDFVLHQ